MAEVLEATQERHSFLASNLHGVFESLSHHEGSRRQLREILWFYASLGWLRFFMVSSRASATMKVLEDNCGRFFGFMPHLGG